MRTMTGVTVMLCASLAAWAQVGMERMIVVAPMVGAGTVEDPRRPLGFPRRGCRRG